MKTRWGVLAGVMILTFALFLSWRPAELPDRAHGGKAVSQWVQDALSTDYVRRREGREALVMIGPEAVAHLRPYLAVRPFAGDEWLKRARRHLPFFEKNPTERTLLKLHALEALAELGTNASGAGRELVRALGEKNVEAQKEAESALSRMGRLAVAELLRGASHYDEQVRSSSVRLLAGHSGERAVREVVEKGLRDRSARVRVEAIGALEAAGPESGTEQLLLKALGAKEAVVRARAARALGNLGYITSSGALVEAFGDNSCEVRFEAARSIRLLEPGHEGALSELIECLDTEADWKGAYFIAELGPEAARAIPGLISALEREQVPRPFRSLPSSAFALGKMGKAAVGPLMELLRHSSAPVQLSAILTLGNLGPDAAGAEEALKPFLAHKSTELREAAALALGQIGIRKQFVFTALESCLTADDIFMRSTAAHVLRKLDPDRDVVIAAE
ncbi:MAG: HEAT repeat domain-containing protein [Verrucomicrobiota bacterium]|nr:HEAT repeat domain-containing protein [Verrucomicrobiota bacterium]